jgi:hypothetical protein|uniref:Ubiquitin-like protease family profile domain-containing protein n=1 Tax=viral metagenome TaxID=1070528 RepID=A0A6C0CL98_9ZZZZ
MKTRRKHKRSSSKHSKKHNKSQKKKDGLAKVNCSPNPNKKGFTCYSDNALFKMKKLWNIRHHRDKIKSNDPKLIWNSLKKKMSNSCDKESCWLRSKFMEGNLDSELLNYTFAPKAPKEWKKNPDEWLSSLDIESVMKQYEKFYKCFVFLGPSPIDYDRHKLYGECVWEELCKFNLSQEIKKNKNKIGIIFNTHPHYKSGEHWISMFINIKQKFIIYFDSNGNKPPSEVKKFVNEVTSQGKQLGIDFKYYVNNIEHQETESECGMYCLYFIIEMLKDKSATHFLENKINDKEVFILRKKYFNIQ